uniref:Uncharacterized protein n=1 Tax=Hyaloperonospora arabidopsidis (strain Emoy2) TaxID=559515 RepID=M4BPX6_HYAAE
MQSRDRSSVLNMEAVGGVVQIVYFHGYVNYVQDLWYILSHADFLTKPVDCRVLSLMRRHRMWGWTPISRLRGLSTRSAITEVTTRRGGRHPPLYISLACLRTTRGRAKGTPKS